MTELFRTAKDITPEERDKLMEQFHQSCFQMESLRVMPTSLEIKKDPLEDF